MPPLPTLPRVILYHQTHYHEGRYVSMLPLHTASTGISHVILGALHINEPAGSLTLNDHVPSDPIFTPLWEDMRALQAAGIKVLLMVGGACQGSFARLDGPDPARFESHYIGLRNLLRQHNFDGVDLDIEEPMSLPGVLRLVDRLRADFGPSPRFLLTLAPVASALVHGAPHLSGFDYEALEVMRAPHIDWYHAQFYCGWGDAASLKGYEHILANGWPPEKVVMGVLTNPRNAASGWVQPEVLYQVLLSLMEKYPRFGGVSGWEYFNALPGDRESPHEWAESMRLLSIQ